MTTKRFFLVLAVTLVAGGAHAQSIKPWKTVGDWTLYVDAGTRNGCTMEKTFDNGMLLKFGMLPRRDAGYLAVYRQEWTDIQYGKKTKVKFSFDGVEYDGLATGDIAKPWYGGYSETKDRQMVYDFAKKYNMTVTGHHGREFSLSLDGTLNAMKELEACQAAQE